MSPSTSSSTEIVRRAFLKFDESMVLAAVDSLDLRAHSKVSAVVGIPLRNLQQRRDVTSFALSAPLAAVRALLELLALEPLEKVVEALGEHADSPSYDQLAVAVDQLLAGGSTIDDVVALLAFAIAEEFPAGPHCRRLLEERADLQLPELPDAVPVASLLSPKETDPQVREQRRARREQEKQRKKGPSSVRPARPVKAKPGEKVASPAPSDQRATVGSSEPAPRRAVRFTPVELERFSPEHPLVGWVVLAEVPFDAVDPQLPEQRSKERPALVIAAGDDAVLVRAIYTSPGVNRRVFQAWRRLGLAHVCYVDDDRTALSASGSLERLGQLSDAEWNALL
jgi:hypothetical protein